MRRGEEKARALGKTLTEGAKRRLFDLLGQDLRLMMNEISKLAVYVGDKKGIEEDDVDEATAGQRSFQAYDLDDALAAADFAKGAAILDDLFAEGERSEVILGRLAAFFRNVLAAQTWLREKSRTKDEIFQAFFPYISRNFGDLYRRKYEDFFGVVEGLPPAELNALLGKLRQLDKTLKSTSSKDTGEKILFEAFLREFCVARKKQRLFRRSRAEERDLPAQPGLVAAAGVLLDGPLLDRRVDGLVERGEHLERAFAVLGLDGLADLADVGSQGGLRLGVDGFPAQAAAVLPYR